MVQTSNRERRQKKKVELEKESYIKEQFLQKEKEKLKMIEDDLKQAHESDSCQVEQLEFDFRRASQVVSELESDTHEGQKEKDRLQYRIGKSY